MGIKSWPPKLVKHLADTTCVSPSPAGPAGLLCGTLSKTVAKSIMIKSVCLCSRFTAPIQVADDVVHKLDQLGFANWVLC